MSASQRRKGHNFERKIAADIRALGIPARRGRQDYRGDAEPDVVVEDVSMLGIDPWIECKTGARPPIWKALEQAQEAAGIRTPIVVAHRDRGPTVAVMEWSELLALLVRAA